MMLLSKTGAIIHRFEPQFSLRGAFNGKSDLSVCSNRAIEETDKADFFYLGGTSGGTRYKALIFCTIIFCFVVAARTYLSSAAAAIAAVLVREGPSLDPFPLRLGLLSYPPP